jgi:predicted MarR family transcription regulator
MATGIELNPVDEAVLDNLGIYGKKIKKYELSFLIKRDVACSDLQLTVSLRKLVKSGLVLETSGKEILLNTDHI